MNGEGWKEGWRCCLVYGRQMSSACCLMAGLALEGEEEGAEVGGRKEVFE